VATERLQIRLDAVDNTRRAFGQFQSRLQRVRSSVFNLRNALIGIGTAAVVRGFASAGIQIENLGVQLKALFGSAQAGQRALEQVTKFAATTPFELRNIQQGITSLATVRKAAAEAGVSFEELLKITGNTAVLLGGDFALASLQVQRSLSAGVASAELFRERGVSAMAGFEAGTRYSIQETIKRLRKAFGTGGEFGQLMEELSKTVSGSISNLQDAFFIFQASVAKGFFDELKKQLGDLQTLVATNQKEITQFGILVGEKIASAMQSLRKATILVVENFDKFLAVLLAIIAAKFIVFITNLISALKLLGIAVTGLTAIMMRNPLFVLAMGAATIIGGIALATKGLRKEVKDLDKTLKDSEAVDEFLNNIGEIDNRGRSSAPQSPMTPPFGIGQDFPETQLPQETEKVKTTIEKIQEALNTVVGKQMTEWENKMSNIYQLAIEGVFKGIAGISRALAESIILGKNLGEALRNLVRQALVEALAAVIRMVLEKAFLLVLEKILGVELKKSTDIEQKKLGIMKKQTAELTKQAGLRILLALLGAAEGGQVRGQRAEGGSVLRRAAGGRTTQTNAYLVGERGRELFVPNQDGEIISNERLQNLGTSVHFTINATDVKGVKELLIDNRATIVNIINSALNQKGKQALV
jgi:hypothetical protein